MTAKNSLHTVDSKIVSDIYHAFSDVVVNNFYFGGGMSTQLYLPEFLRRLSSDVDTNGVNKLSFGVFKESYAPGLEKLIDQGYTWSSKKRRNTYDLRIENAEDVILLQYPKKRGSSDDFMSYVCDRESQNTQCVEYQGVTLNVMAMEDIVTRKFLRMETFIESYGLKMPKTKNFFELRNRINSYKKEIYDNLELSPEEVALDIAKIRFLADYFDVMALTVYKGFDAGYLKESVENFDGLKGKYSPIVDLLQTFNPNAFSGNSSCND